MASLDEQESCRHHVGTSDYDGATTSRNDEWPLNNLENRKIDLMTTSEFEHDPWRIAEDQSQQFPDKPTIEDDDDWHPKHEPLDMTPEAADDRCLTAIAQRPLVAIGNRPKDWIAHDLLCYKILRDARLNRFHRLLKAPASWMQNRAEKLDDSHLRAAQLSALHFNHLQQLDAGRDGLYGLDDFDVGPNIRRWQRLWNCQPYGAVYGGPSSHPCGLLHFCPWCRARVGVFIWQRLEKAIGKRRLLLLHYSATSHSLEMFHQRQAEVRSGIPDDALGTSWWMPPRYRHSHLYSFSQVDYPSQFKLANPRPIPDPRSIPGFQVPCIADPYTVLTTKQMAAARSEIRAFLDHWAKRFNIIGGLKIFTVEPDIYHDQHANLQFPQYRFNGYLLGQPAGNRDADPRLRQFLEKGAEYTNANAMGFGNYFLKHGELRSRMSPLLIDALAYPAVMLFRPEQFPSYHRNMQSVPLYRPFGEWRKYFQKKKSLVGPGRPHKRSARVDYSELRKIARDAWPRLMELARTGGRGRPPLKSLLKKLMAEKNIALTRRQLEQLMQESRNAQTLR